MESLPEETQKEMKEAMKNGKLDEFFEKNLEKQNNWFHIIERLLKPNAMNAFGFLVLKDEFINN